MWNRVSVNANLIQRRTERAVLIKLPKSEFRFWHPGKLVRQTGKNGYYMTISYTDDFEFNIFRTGNGKYNANEKIEERRLTGAEFEKYFE